MRRCLSIVRSIFHLHANKLHLLRCGQSCNYCIYSRGSQWESPETDTPSQLWFGSRLQQRERGGRRSRSFCKQEHLSDMHPTQLDPSFEWYHDLFTDCIDGELEEARRQLEEMIENWSLDRLIKEGYTLIDCQAKSHGYLFHKPIVRFFKEKELPYHQFSQGDLVTVSKESPVNGVTAEGVVYEKGSEFLSAVFEVLPNELTEQTWRLDKGSNETAYQRMKEAVSKMCKVSDTLPVWLRSLIIPTALVHSTPEQQPKVPDISSILHACQEQPPGIFVPTPSILASMEIEIKTQKVQTVLDKQTKGVLSLNASQLEAIDRGLRRRLSLVQGPPGTGKTYTAVHLIKAFLSIHPTKSTVLATAQSNVAVDQLLAGCLKLGLNAVRLGQPVKVSPEMQDRTLDAHIAAHPKMKKVEAIKKEIENLRMRKSDCKEEEIEFLVRELSLKRGKLLRTMHAISKDVVGKADVVCATCIGAGSDLLKKSTFDFVVLDEATQCTEPESLVALVKASRDAKVVMIGDHQQLPPTVLSRDVKKNQILSSSLFQRFVEIKHHLSTSQSSSDTGMSSAVRSFSRESLESLTQKLDWAKLLFEKMHATMLREQHRMHPLLSAWPSKQFYDCRLIDSVRTEDRVPPKGIPWPLIEGQTAPLLFVSVVGYESVKPHSQSKFNLAQAKMVAHLVTGLIEGGLPPSDIGVITPYSAQVQAIENALFDKGHAKRGELESNFVEVKTVDGYQGREKEVIVLSSVRSNAKGHVGFLDDPRRFNVAVTRGRRGLIVLGNPRTLKHDAVWNAWLEFMRSKGLQVDGRRI